MTAHFEAAALAEYRAAVVFSEEHFGLGVQFVDAVQAALDAISRDPGRFQPVGGGLRVFRMKRFPYNLIYEAGGDSLVVYAVAHHRRQPGYWKNRRKK